ncbi:MAG TPA: PLP-dependent aminotransferase family protein [Symbiobacteriaceae bacterium]|nr:PLP-dependent aminotransferase family protein [Symbiobacteriaceae bacterium]
MIELDRTSGIPLYRQVKEQLRTKILTGVLPPGTKLPPERNLAGTIGVNRTTIVTAYKELAAEGLVEGRVGHGTVVLAPVIAPPPGPVRPMQWAASSAGEDPVMADVAAILRRPGAISFANGEMDSSLYPAELLAEAFAALLAGSGDFLGYGPAMGYAPLREALAARTGGRPEEILVLGGSQTALYLLNQLLLQPGDSVVVEAPSYLNSLGIFPPGVRVIPAKVDEDGLQTEGLGELFLRYRPKLLFTLPTFQNPLGVTLSLARRHQLLELAAKYQVGIVEDDPYGELHLEGERLPTLKSLDPGGYVIYLSSFSKSLTPALRVAWMAAPPAVVERVAASRGALDFRAALLNQAAADRILRSGALDRHLVVLRAELLARRDALVGALAQWMPPGVSWRVPAGGYHLWCTLPAPLRARRLLSEAAREGVAFIPGDYYGPGEDGRRGIRLNFTHPNAAEIPGGVQRLAGAIRRLLREDGVMDRSDWSGSVL